MKTQDKNTGAIRQILLVMLLCLASAAQAMVNSVHQGSDFNVKTVQAEHYTEDDEEDVMCE